MQSKKLLPGYVVSLFLLQPILDCISFWSGKLGWSSTPTLILRLAVLAVTLLAGFMLSRRKWIYLLCGAVCVLLGAGHIYALFDYGRPQNLVSDLTNYIRVLQMPLMAICLITFLRRDEECARAVKWGMAGSLAIILLVTVLAALTGTEPHTYVDGKGYIGWFNTTNAQSNVLCMLVPVVLAWAYEKKGLKSAWFWMTGLLGFGAMFLLGTRLTLFGLAATGFGLAASVILIKPACWKNAGAFICLTAVFILLLPVSPMNNHQGTFDNVQENRQKIADAHLAQYELKPLNEPGLSEEELAERKAQWTQALSYTYNYHAHDFVKIFGLEQTVEEYNYSSDVAQITAQRPKKLLFGKLLMENSPTSARVFGVELERFTVGKNIYDVENDLHGIYFLYGAAGLAALLVFLGYFFVLIVLALIRDAKTYFTLDAAAWGIALLCCLMHIYNTAGVLRRPNSSFYLSAALAMIYYLVKIKTYPKEK